MDSIVEENWFLCTQSIGDYENGASVHEFIVKKFVHAFFIAVPSQKKSITLNLSFTSRYNAQSFYLDELKKGRKTTNFIASKFASQEGDWFTFSLSISFSESSPQTSTLGVIFGDKNLTFPIYFYSDLNFRRPSTFLDPFNACMNRLMQKVDLDFDSFEDDSDVFFDATFSFVKTLCWICEKLGCSSKQRKDLYFDPDPKSLGRWLISSHGKFWGLVMESQKKRTLEQYWKNILAFQPLFIKTLDLWAKGYESREILFLTLTRIIIDFLHNDEVSEITKRANPGEFFLRYPNNLLGLELNERNCLALSGLSPSRTEDKFIFPLTTDYKSEWVQRIIPFESCQIMLFLQSVKNDIIKGLEDGHKFLNRTLKETLLLTVLQSEVKSGLVPIPMITGVWTLSLIPIDKQVKITKDANMKIVRQKLADYLASRKITVSPEDLIFMDKSKVDILDFGIEPAFVDWPSSQ